ncbi:32079_t:CDS:2 [Gigaspora margarita]|uniref:32079_t:CDS:1 n=1 Tax=Gigaspora margarita TaxID=4874 RepID=A0ABN7UL06_GIGMA|nr:32079_t:CDS:2 [Gigaspora margarita]
MKRQIKGTLVSSFALLDPSTKSNIIDETDREISLIRLKASYPLCEKLIQSSESSESKEIKPEIDELTTYLSLPDEPGVDPLAWWKVNAHCFPTVAHIAADYFALQATSIPCKCIFSVDEETIVLAENGFEETVRASLSLKNRFDIEIIE